MKYTFSRAAWNPGYAIGAEDEHCNPMGFVGYACNTFAALKLIACLKKEL